MSILIRRQENGIPVIVMDGTEIMGTDTDTLPEVRAWLSGVYPPEVVEKLVAPLEADPELREGPAHTTEVKHVTLSPNANYEAVRMVYAALVKGREARLR